MTAVANPTSDPSDPSDPSGPSDNGAGPLLPTPLATDVTPALLQDLPLPLLGTILRLSAVRNGAFSHLAPALNLMCRATHAALPDAFTGSERPANAATNGAQKSDTSGPSDTFLAEVGDTWPPTAVPIRADMCLKPTAVISSVTTPVLHLNLDRLGDAAYSDHNLAASVRRTGLRFTWASSLRLTSVHPQGVHGTALFAEHAAPLMANVHHLFIVGPSASRLPPFWQLPGFASGLTAGVRELSLCAHHSTAVPLAARLPDAFPALTAARLTVYVDSNGPQRDLEAREHYCHLTVRASPLLRTLMVSFKLGGTSRVPDPKDGAFALTVGGHPTSLRHLRLHTLLMPDISWRSPHRDWSLRGFLPALRCLDVTVAPRVKPEHQPDDSYWDCSPPLHVPFLLPPLRNTCPALSTLVLRTGAFAGVRHWAPALQALAPLAASLARLEVHHHLPLRWPYNDGRKTEDPSFGVPPLLARLLPGTKVCLIGV